jgi:Leucine-rich repeat (LRR) protein
MLSQLFVDKCANLSFLDCSHNRINKMFLDLPKLEELNCVANQLSILNLFYLPALKNVDCRVNNIELIYYAKRCGEIIAKCDKGIFRLYLSEHELTLLEKSMKNISDIIAFEISPASSQFVPSVEPISKQEASQRIYEISHQSSQK